jgi:hypothetical protein
MLVTIKVSYHIDMIDVAVGREVVPRAFFLCGCGINYLRVIVLVAAVSLLSS